jgi:hypothetical protein
VFACCPCDHEEKTPSFNPKNSLRRPKVVNCKHDRLSSLEIHPKCAACQLGKQQRRFPSTKFPRKDDQSISIRSDPLQPGDCVCLDQYVSALPGRLPHAKGTKAPKDKYCGGTKGHDHVSPFVFLHHHPSFPTVEFYFTPDILVQLPDFIQI